MRRLLIVAVFVVGCSTSKLGKQADGSYLVATGQVLRPAGSLITFPGRPVDLCLGNDGRFVFAKEDNGLTVIDAAKKVVVQRLSSSGTSGHGLVALTNGEVWMGDAKSTLHCASMADGKWAWKRKIVLPKPKVGGEVYPNCLALQGERLWVAASRSNTLVCVDLATAKILQEIPVDIAPYGIAISCETAYVSCWGGPTPTEKDLKEPSSGVMVKVDDRGVVTGASVLKIDLRVGKVVERATVALQPMQVLLHPSGNVLVGHGNADHVTVLDPKSLKITATINTELDRRLPFGTMPNALAITADGKQIYVANGGTNSIAVVDWASKAVQGHIPCGWFPGALFLDRGNIWVANVKGVGMRERRNDGNYSVYDTTGLVQKISVPSKAELREQTKLAKEGAGMKFALNAIERGKAKKGKPVPERLGETSPIEHVVYILKENRTYDQVFGDMAKGDGDAELCIYGREVTPNMHALADEFVLLDNFYCNGVNSADGHSWAMEGAVTGYLEKSFGGFTRSYPYGGDDAINAAASGFIWDPILARGLSFSNFGEFDSATPDPKRTWQELYEESKGGTITTKFKKDMPHQRMRRYTDPDFPGWNMNIPDQVRADIFLSRLKGMTEMANFTIIYLPQDHTNGTGASTTTPRAHVADNDLAVGRIVDALSHSKWWPKMAIFVMEDDPQNGFDHVDGHRSPALVISPFIKRHTVSSNFYNQTSMLHTMLRILGCPAQTQFMAQSPLMSALFTETPDTRPYTHHLNLIPLDEMNKPKNQLSAFERKWAELSARQDLSKPDAIEDDTMNRILWHDAKGTAPYPEKFSGAHGRGLKNRGLIVEIAEDED
ncbi:MAG: alkaline phosphatase family protein [Fimbriimonadaceae bacterium]